MTWCVRFWQGVIALSVSSAFAALSAQPTVDLRGTAMADGRLVPDTVVWLEAPHAPPPAAPAHAVLDQRNLTFSPRVLVVRTGTSVEFPNNDRVFHNVFSFRDGRRFDLGLYPVGSMKRVLFDRPGVSRIFCNIHPNMAAYIVTVDTPYFAKSDDRGGFMIGDVNPGAYTYHAWRAGATAELTGTWSPGDGVLAIAWP